VISNFEEKDFASVFVKSSTGFYTTENNVPNGATIPSIMLMLENATPLPVKPLEVLGLMTRRSK
jgi:deoxyribose-phosphate aldolase